MTLCRLKSDKKGGKREWEGDREKGPRDFDKSSKNADARAWYSSFFFFFVMYRVFERKEIGIFKGKDSVHFFVADEVRQFHLMIEMERHDKK